MGAPKGGATKGGAPRGGGRRRVGPQRVGPRRVGGPKFRAFFSLSRHNFLSFFSLLGVFSWNFGGVFEAQAGALKCARLEFSGCRVRAPAGRSGGAAGVPHDSPRAQTCTFQGPGLQKHQQNSTKGPQERERRMKIVAGGGKKRAKFWAVRRRAVRRRAVRRNAVRRNAVRRNAVRRRAVRRRAVRRRAVRRRAVRRRVWKKCSDTTHITRHTTTTTHNNTPHQHHTALPQHTKSTWINTHASTTKSVCSTSANFDFGQFRLRPISTSVNFDFGQFRLRPIRFRPAGRSRIVRSRIGRSRASLNEKTQCSNLSNDDEEEG